MVTRSLGAKARVLIAVTTLILLVVAACKPTPGYLERWKNRPGSEDRFADYLKDPKVSHAVHVRALELLVEQWEYSSGIMRGGGPLNEMRDTGERDATIRDAIPEFRRLYESDDVLRVRVRDAVWNIREATENQEIRTGLEDILVDWFTNHWQPCVLVGGVSVSNLFAAVGRQRGEGFIVDKFENGDYNDIICTLQSVGGIEWLKDSDPVVNAFISRWDSGNLPDDAQRRVTLLDEVSGFATNPIMKTWMWSKMQDENEPALHRNIFADLIARHRTDDDFDRYAALLAMENNYRWMGVQGMIQMRNTDGIEAVLAQLPATGEYRYYDGNLRYDGFKRASNTVCGMQRISELGDNTRPVFEAHINDENPHSRALAIHCLARYGSNSSVQRLNAAKAAIPGDQMVPGWSQEGTTFHQLIDETIQAIVTPDAGN